MNRNNHGIRIWYMIMYSQRIEAEAAYKQAVANANDCQYQVHISQVCILKKSRAYLILLTTSTEINSVCLQKNGDGIRPDLKGCKFLAMHKICYE